MAVETKPQQESVAVEANGHRPRVRLHEEILPPELEPSTPVAIRSSRRALAIMAVGMILVQLISAPIGHRLNSVARSGTDDYTLWQRYVSTTVPDVLIIGGSPARTDVDPPRLAAALSTALGRPVTVETMGFAGQNVQFLNALMYRIMKRPSHPKWIVIALVGPDLNAGCALCGISVNRGLWDISDMTDPGFVQMALRSSPTPAWLVTGWVFPVFAYYPSLIALQCLAFDYGRAAARATLGRVPLQLKNPTPCESLAAYKWGNQATMTQSDYVGSLDTYLQTMRDYRMTAAMRSSVRDLVATARSGGSNVVFLRPPLHPGLQSLFPEDVASTKRDLNTLAQELNVGVLDLSAAVPDDPDLWVDSLHLDRGGADYFTPQLATNLAPVLGG